MCIDAVKRSLSGLARFGAASFNSLGGISSGPAALSGSNLARKCSIIVGVKLMVSRVNLKFCRGKTGMSSSTSSVNTPVKKVFRTFALSWSVVAEDPCLARSGMCVLVLLLLFM